jgi:hypothetical protein
MKVFFEKVNTTDIPLTPELAKEIQECFKDPDLSLIKSILYFDGWSDYEECGGILVFKAIDDSIQIVDYGYCVIADDNTNYWKLREVSEDIAKTEIEDMEKVKKEMPELY